MLPGCRPAQDCGLCGFGKCGLTSQAHAVAASWPPRVRRAWRPPAGPRALKADADAAQQFVFEVGFDEEPTAAYGAPLANVTWTVRADSTIALDVQYATRPSRAAESVGLQMSIYLCISISLYIYPSLSLSLPLSLSLYIYI